MAHKDKDNVNTIIVNNPKKLNPFRKGTEWSLTFIGWCIWLFLIRPIMLVFLWFIGFKMFYVHMIRLKGLSSLILFFANYLFIILFILLFVRGWNVYNRIRFRGREHRQHATAVRPEELDKHFLMPEGSAASIQTWDEIRVDFHKGGQFEVMNEAPPETQKRIKGLYHGDIL
jgi:biofilm PGA synthesis protein PgaD